MEIKQFQDSRDRQLSEFQKSYDFLKQEYNSNLLAAIKEEDPAQQQKLISQLLTLNSEMTKELGDIIASLNKGTDKFNPATIDKLTAELIEYQKQYQEIDQAKDRTQTLKYIYATDKKTLETTQFWFNIYLGLLIFLCFLIIVFLFRTNSWYSIQSSVASVISAPSSQ